MNLILLPFYEAFEALYGSCERWQSDSLPGGKDLCLDKITRHSRGNPLNFMGALQTYCCHLCCQMEKSAEGQYARNQPPALVYEVYSSDLPRGARGSEFTSRSLNERLAPMNAKRRYRTRRDSSRGGNCHHERETWRGCEWGCRKKAATKASTFPDTNLWISGMLRILRGFSASSVSYWY